MSERNDQRMNKHPVIFLATVATAVVGAVPAIAYPGQQLSSQAKISLAQARTIATHAVHGTIVSEELETEKGGTGLRYTFDMKTATGTREIGVDAKTGAVLENDAEKGKD